MICYRTVKRFCKDNIEEIENYAEAIADKESTWDCHHKMELHGDYKNTLNEMKMMNLYYNRPAYELVFLKHEDHLSLHHKGKKSSDETKKKISQNHVGMLGKNHSKETKDKIKNKVKESWDNYKIVRDNHGRIIEWQSI